MKILLLNQTFYPDNLATSQQIADLAVFLKDKGHEVSVVSGQRAYEERSKKFPKRETWNGVNIFRVSSTGLGKKRFRYRILDSLTFFISLAGKLLFFPKQDLVISFTSPPLMGFWGTLFCWMKGGRSVQWLMDVNPDAAFEVGYLKRRSVLGAILNTVFEFTLTSAQNVVVLDRWMKKRMLEHGAHEEKITIVPPWSILAGGSVVITEESQAFKKQHGLSGKFVVLYSGNHSVVHPLTTLLEAALVLREEPQIAFLFIGAGLRTQDVYHFKVRHKLANIVQLPLQPREKMGASFGAADLHAVVMGSKMSGLVHTSKIYSILASGKPFVFVGPKNSHAGDTVNECQSGFVVEHEQVSELVSAIKRTQALSVQEKQEIGNRNIQYVLNRFQPQKTLQRFYDSVVCPVTAGATKSLAVSGDPISDTPT